MRAANAGPAATSSIAFMTSLPRHLNPTLKRVGPRFDGRPAGPWWFTRRDSSVRWRASGARRQGVAEAACRLRKAGLKEVSKQVFQSRSPEPIGMVSARDGFGLRPRARRCVLS